MYTINYKDLIAFKKDRNKSIKDYDATISKIFNQILNIKSNVLIDNLIVITFDKTVQFVDPLFFILLFDLHCEYKSTLVIDIRYMDDKPQHYIHRLLTQYSDLKNFQVYSPYAKKDNQEIYITINTIIKSDEDERDRQFNRLLENDFESSHLFSSVVHKKSLINDSKYEYSMLPILKLRNFKLSEVDKYVHKDALDPYEARRSFYNQLSLEQAKNSIEQYRKNLQDKIEDLLVAVGLGEKGLSSSFRDIFFELIDNIRKHTPEKANAHISFRKDKVSDLYELIISDNSCKGFLNTYRETLVKEKKRLQNAGVTRNLLKNYSDVINDIDNKEYKKVLKGIFQIQQEKSDNIDDEMHIHQIPRIAMHFGLPLLIKLLKKLSTTNDTVKSKLKLYLHNDNQFFEIIYSFKDGKFQLDVNDKSEHGKEGSYIIITFPTDVNMQNVEDANSLVSINLQNNDYKLFIDKKDDIAEQISKFTFYLDTHIVDDLNPEVDKSSDSENKCTFIKYTGQNTFSEFLRNIYLYAYTHDIEDMVIVNVPLYEYANDKSKRSNENTEHIKLLETIIYGDDEEKYEKSLNVLFYSDRYPEAILIGGKNKEEYCYLNQLLPSWGQFNDSNIRNSSKIKKPKGFLHSKLFVSLEKGEYIVPFELFEISDENRRSSPDTNKVSILQDMLGKYLNEVAKRDDIHIDTGSGYHIDRFMEFKKVFEDSRWVRRLAFRLAMSLPMKPETIKYYLYGTDKYTNMLISLCYTFLDLETFERFKYKLFNIYDDYDYRVIKDKIETTQKEGGYEIYLVSSVVVGAKRDKLLIKDYNIKAIPAIRLNIESADIELGSNIDPLVTVTLNKDYIHKVTEQKYCDACEGQRDVPLLEFTRNDPFFVKDTFFDIIHSKKIQSYSTKNNMNVKWFDSLNFGHVKRGNNHFLYYINTIKFFNQNRFEIEHFLSRDVRKKINHIKEENIILLTSSHDTNNNFVALVNQEIFNNEAIVLSFNKSRGEANFHDLKSYEYFDWGNTRVFFVDDSIASSHTLKYFYQLLRSVPNIMTRPNVGLDGVIVMIDRISSYDETILCSYLKDSKDIDKPNEEMQKEKLKAIYAFSTFDIKPIKSEVEKCFLCTRRDRYSELAKKSALDLTTFQMVKRAYKLKKIEYRSIQPAKEKPLVTRFKNYLKAMATTYIYQEFSGKKYDDFMQFDDFIQGFSIKMYENIISDKKERFEKYDKVILRKIIKFQSEIALIKALSSPKLSYYYDIRRWAISIILSKLGNAVKEVQDSKNKDFVLIYKLKDDIENLKLENDEFLKFYKNMTNLHLINIYFATLGYFEDSKILDTDYINLYYKTTQNQDVQHIDGDSLLHTYPFAVKFIITNNLEKAIYFENNLQTIFNSINYKGKERKKKFSYINALRIENTLYWEKHIEKETNFNLKNEIEKLMKKESLDDKVNQIKNLFKLVFKNLKVHMFISPYATTTPKNYQEYLNESETNLINVLDSFNNVGSYPSAMSSSIQKVFYGAVDVTDKNEDNIVLEKVALSQTLNKIDNTWVNEYTDDYIVIRLTSLNTEELFKSDGNIKNNSPVWFRPIGCIVIEHNRADYDYRLYIEVTRTILSLKEYLVGYIEKEFNHGVIQEALNAKYKDSVINNVNHSIKKYINIGAKTGYMTSSFASEDFKAYMERDNFSDENKYLKYLYREIDHYSFGLVNLASISDIVEQRTKDRKDLVSILSDDYIEQLKSFFNIASNIGMYRTIKEKQSINILTSKLVKGSLSLLLDSNQFEYFLFEIIFNIVKAAYSLPVGSIEIEIESIHHGIKIYNNVNPKEIEKLEKTPPYAVNSKSGLGTKKIIEMLAKNNYFIDFKISKNILFVSSSGSEYNICMKIIRNMNV